MKIKINNDEYVNITQHQSGKMLYMLSLNTNKYTNKNCLKLMKNENQNLICHHCFVDKQTKQYRDMIPANQHNSNILTKRLLTKEEIKELSSVIINQVIFRFESFGDLNNEIQLINYINIAKACKYTKFGLWTKHFRIILDYFKKGFKMPKNITLVLSAPFMNNFLNNEFVEIFKKYHKRVITFTVTDKKSESVNCGDRQCVKCRNCYDSKKPHNVLELVK